MLDQSTVTVLLVEDDEVDIEAVRRAFAKEQIANRIEVAHNGLEALDCLRGTGSRSKIEGPYMILLDLNMPKMNGIEFLKELRADNALCNSIVFVLTTSDADQDKLAAYREHVAGYLLKGKVGEGFVEIVRMLECYSRYVEFPPQTSSLFPTQLRSSQCKNDEN